MTEEQFKHSQRLIRYVGLLVTVLFFAIIVPYGGFSLFLPYILLVTLIIAVLFIVVYFGYSTVQGGRVTKA